ncbi:MAG TPA: DDE transposase, partial [Planctomycetaceae bacterium]|nr:DDE transposase [Planctomycetaceae bacterium]
MAFGKRRKERQAELFVATDGLARSPGHVFFRRLNELLAAEGCDAWVVDLCRPKYADGVGRRSIPPGVY